MAYATLALFRSLTNFTISEISDTEVTALIADADRAVIRLTTTEVYLERLRGNVDGTNVDFKTRFRPIADKDADSSVDGSDVTVYYATFDSVTNYVELGSAQTVTSIQEKEGIITMTTAPTSTTAEAGVFAIYRYDSLGQTSFDVYKLAASYYLAYMASNKIRGKTPNYSTTETSVREDVVSQDWLVLCYETLGLQDKLFFGAPKGHGILPMFIDSAYHFCHRSDYVQGGCGNAYGYGDGYGY